MQEFLQATSEVSSFVSVEMNGMECGSIDTCVSTGGITVCRGNKKNAL